ncbi:hypothetical protein FJY63_10000 [Candidatus Sumerlaeota bacterium]|nr:hypothetical protein [Candidatus Sumerlaeota bacterium]
MFKQNRVGGRIAFAALCVVITIGAVGLCETREQGGGKSSLGGASGRATAVLRAGAAAVDTTPEKLPVIVNGGFLEGQAGRVNDRLHARCLILDDGRERMAIVVVDICVMPRSLLDEAKQLAHQATGIRTDRILISATHTHSAPSVMGALGSDADPEYSRFLPGRIAAAIELANKNLAPARVGWAVADAPEYTHCRRWILRPDKMLVDPFDEKSVRAMMHPGFQNPDYLGPAGAVDPQIVALSVQSAEGRPIALLANFSMHYYGAAALSADYYGRFAEKIARLIGGGDAEPPFVGIMSQGTSGDLQWMDYGQPAPKRDIDAYAEGIARIVADACRKIQYRDKGVSLAMREKEITLGVRLPDAKRLEWAKKIVTEMKGRKPKTKPEVYAREQLFLVAQPKHRLKLQALRVGDLGIVAIPCEVFGITGLKIKAQSPLDPTFTMELANGEDGYIPPPAQHLLGGYTTWPARTAGLEVEAEPKIVETVLDLLEDVSGRPRRAIVETNGPYARTVLASKPLAYWRMGEFNGPVALDATGNKNHGQYEGGVAFYLEGPSSDSFSGKGQINRAPQFAGGRMKARFPRLGPAYSVEMWFYNALPTDIRPITGSLFSFMPTRATRGDHLAVGGTMSEAGALFFWPRQPDVAQAIRGKIRIVNKTWHHVVLVRDGRKAFVYLNGATTPEISGETSEPISGGAKEVFIGGGWEGASFEGKIDEVAIYNRALSPDEIARHYRAAQ